jgi:hypothetical protein
MDEASPLEGKVALITGASRGLAWRSPGALRGSVEDSLCAPAMPEDSSAWRANSRAGDTRCLPSPRT